jgi:hypothetical protein
MTQGGIPIMSERQAQSYQQTHRKQAAKYVNRKRDREGDASGGRTEHARNMELGTNKRIWLPHRALTAALVL